MSEALIQIQKQYERIPSFVCIEGCTDCCGPVPFAEAEWASLPLPPKALTGPVCQFKGETGCTIYEHRPMLCRLFGAVDDQLLACPYGRKPEKPMTEQQGKTIMRHYLKHPMAQDPLTDMRWASSLLNE